MSVFVGVDVGGTTSTVAIGDEHRKVVHVSDQFATLAAQGPAATIQAIVDAVRTGLQQLSAEMPAVRRVVLSTPGPATLDGILLKTPNLDAALWDRCPIREQLETALGGNSDGPPVGYIGDGQAAALGEFSLRSGAVCWTGRSLAEVQDELSSLFMVIVGTGLGGGEVRKRQVVRGQQGRAGHVGHILLPEYAFRYSHDRQLVVGNATSTVESAVSLTGLTHQLEYRLGLDAWRDHALNQSSEPVKEKAKRLRQLADAGDELALQLFDDQAKALGIALLSVNYLGDYDLLVIGGGVCDLSPSVRDRYRQIAEDTYRQYALDGFRNLDRFEFSACGDEAPVIGALAQAYA